MGMEYKTIFRYRLESIKEFLKRHDELLIFSFAFIIEILFGLILIYKYGSTIFDFDSISYLYNARTVFDKGEYSGLSVLVGTWLPVFQMQLVPFVTVDWFYTTGFAGTIVNAIMTGGISVFLYRILGGKNNRFAVLAPVIFLSNIYVLIFGAIPLSEQASLFFITAASYYFKKYLDTGKLNEFINCSMMLVFGSFTRYEIWVVAIFAVSVFLIKEIKNKNTHRAGYAHLPLLGIAAWLFLNFLIHKNALWFIKNPFSLGVNSIISLYTELYYFKDSVYLTLNHAWIQMSLTFGIMLYLALVSIVLLVVMGRKKDLLPLVMFFIPAAVNIVLMFMGSSVGWQRYFYATAPAIVILMVLFIENALWILVYFNPVKAVRDLQKRMDYKFDTVAVIIIVLIGVIGVAAAAALSNEQKIMNKSSEVILSREDADSRPWLYQGFDISNGRICSTLKYNGSVYRSDLDFELLKGLPVKDFSRIKDVIGTEKILMAYPDISRYTPNLFSVSQEIHPSQIIDDFNYKDYGNIMMEPWKYDVKFVLISEKNEGSSIINKWYDGKFYPYNYYYNETWHATFLEHYAPALESQNFILFKLKAGT
jgi:hypothetical protein